VLFVLLVALLVFGPKRLVEMSRSLGRRLRELEEFKDEFKEGLLSMSDEDKPEEERSGKRYHKTIEKRESKG
jgi:Sec-independent protein translocase protein TatA